MSTYLYRIRNRDGLFSSGGTSPRFTSKGKSWTSSGALNSHLSQLSGRVINLYLEQGAEVVAYEVVESEAMTETIQERLNARKQRKAERERIQRERWAAHQRKRDEAEFERLKKVLGRE